MTIIRWVLLPAAGSALVLVLLALVCRGIGRTSRSLGIIVAAGLAVRIAAATALFWISYLQLPVLSSLQLGGGFWRMALDAPDYHLTGTFAAEGTLADIPERAPSPAYVQALALWMRLAGTSPYSAVLLNLTCYVTVCALLVAAMRGLSGRHADTVRRVTLLALSASPMLLFVSTQVLKDDFFLLFSTLLSIGTWWIARTVGSPALASWRHLVPGLLALSVGVFVTAGVRVYYPAMASLCLGPAFLVALRARRGVPASFIVGCAVLTLVTASVTLTLGSEDGRRYLTAIGKTHAPGDAVQLVDKARAGFISTGGSTNIASAAEVTELGIADRVRGVAMGLASMFVPLIVLRALGLVAVSGSTAMMALGDLDTLFFDAVFVSMTWLTWRMRRDVQPNTVFLTYSVALVMLLCVLMGYTVTNVGTLVRLRLMVFVPLITLPLAFARLPRHLGTDDGEAAERAVSAAAPTRAG